MGFAFEITPEDIQTAATRLHAPVTYEFAEYLMDNIDCDEAEKAALQADDMDEQTEYVVANIADQLLVDEEFAEYKAIDAAKAKEIINDMLSEYLHDNPDEDYEDYDDIVRIVMSYCEDYISTDEFEQAKLDRSLKVLKHTFSENDSK